MGMYDIVSVICPNCGGSLEFQSKAGKCTLNVYTLSDAPPNILGDLADETLMCNICLAEIQIKVVISAYPYIKSKNKFA